MVWESYQKVIAKKGGAGIDRESIGMFNAKRNNNLYKIWNRMTSGSYFPPPVRTEFIPKKQGGLRPLGIPTVSDRIAQGVVKDYLEPMMENIFHPSSFGYRPGKSAHDALTQCHENCIKYGWVVDVDIQGFFDNINHDMLMQLLGHHTKEKFVLLYAERWLKAGVEQEDGSIVARTKGTPQGGVITLRTHPQTLRFPGGWKLNEDDFNFGYFIKSGTFMINEKITEFGAGRAHQSGTYLISAGETAFRHCRAINGDVWRITDTGLPLCAAGQRERGQDSHTGEFCGLYSKTVTQSDCSGKGFCYFTENHDQQSSQGGTGGVFSQKTPWPKRSRSLKYRSPMTACGSKSSHRFTIFSSPASRKSFPPQILSLNP